MVTLKKKVWESHHKTMQKVYEALEQIISQASELFSGVHIPVEGLNPFKTSLDKTLRNNQGAESRSAKALLSSPLFPFSLCNVGQDFMFWQR